MNYAICQIGSKQVKVIPGEPFEVDRLTSGGKELAVKVLLISEDGKIKIGKPYLKDEVNLGVLDEVKRGKIRVGKYHSKANYRRVTGQRSQRTKVILDVKKA